MAFQRGEVVLVNFPYTDMTALKVRPAVVVSTAHYEAEQVDVILAALTTNIAAATGSMDYILQDWSTAGLRFATAFKPVVATLDSALVLHSIGYLTLRDLSEVHSCLRLAFGLS